MGRPTRLTPEIAKEIVEAIGIGVPRDMAAKSVGVQPSTLYQWLAKGREGIEEYKEFAEAVEKADSLVVKRALVRITQAATKEQHWTAAAWLLERKHPAEFGQRVRVVVQEQLDEFLDALEARLPADVFRQVLDAASLGHGRSAALAALEDGSGGEEENVIETPPEGPPDSG